MYKLEILPFAVEDITNIIHYISFDLKNITAAKQHRDLFMQSFDYILEFPYGCPSYKIKNRMNFEYRVYKVNNYLMFNTINRKEQKIIISRVLYQRMNFNDILKIK